MQTNPTPAMIEVFENALLAYQDEPTHTGGVNEVAALIQAAFAEREARLVGALEWYGEQARLARLIHDEGDAGRHALSRDGGRLATATLATLKDRTHG